MTLISTGNPPLPAQARIGVMQGRLSAPVGNRIQAFPARSWREEFAAAARLKFTEIEWIWESPLEENPLQSDSGREEIHELADRTGVQVSFVCADYFMEIPFARASKPVLESNVRRLEGLIDLASGLGIRGIEIPCVDSSALVTPADEDQLAFALGPALRSAARKGLEIGLETSLPPGRFRALLERIGHQALKANYDTGNSASLGYDVEEEIGAYGRWINNVHIKDRIRGGSTVPLGEGDADIPTVLRLLARAGYAGGFILQGARGLDDGATAARYKAQLEGWLEAARR